MSPRRAWRQRLFSDSETASTLRQDVGMVSDCSIHPSKMDLPKLRRVGQPEAQIDATKASIF
jgi:hypothetical protein